jgi:hypothetical protein
MSMEKRYFAGRIVVGRSSPGSVSQEMLKWSHENGQLERGVKCARNVFWRCFAAIRRLSTRLHHEPNGNKKPVKELIHLPDSR